MRLGQSRRHGGLWWTYPPQIKFQAPQIKIWQYEPVKFLSNLNVNPLLHKRKAPLMTTFRRRFCVRVVLSFWSRVLTTGVHHQFVMRFRSGEFSGLSRTLGHSQRNLLFVKWQWPMLYWKSNAQQEAPIRLNTSHLIFCLPSLQQGEANQHLGS